jgi:ribonuclease BN (tRNA processing enzyme)
MTDNEIRFNLKDNAFSEDGLYELNKTLIEFCRDADILIHDCMYDKENLISKIGWGHSNNISVTHFSILAGVKKLVLFHYDPDFTDSAIDKLLQDALNIIKEKDSELDCIASWEGMELEIVI